MRFGRIVPAAPNHQPQEAERAGDRKCGTPSPTKINPEDEPGGHGPTDRGSAIKECRGEATFALWEPLGDCLGGGRPVAGFSGTEQKTKRRETVEPARERGEHGDDGVEGDGKR